MNVRWGAFKIKNVSQRANAITTEAQRTRRTANCKRAFCSWPFSVSSVPLW